MATKATDLSTYVVRVSFFDENGDPTTPLTALWTLTDDVNNVINGRDQEPIVSPAQIEDILLTDDDLAFSDGENRVLTVESTYDSDLGSGLPLNAEYRFKVADLIALPRP